MPYTFDDVVAALNAVAPNDWAAFLRERLDTNQTHAPLGGIEGRLEARLRAAPKSLGSDKEATVNGTPGFWFSIGLNVNSAGVLSDVLKDPRSRR